MATTLVFLPRVPVTAEPGGLLSMGVAQSRTRLKHLSNSFKCHNFKGFTGHEDHSSIS